MSKKKVIEKLTPEQEAKIPYYQDKYTMIGLNTDPCDRVEAEKAFRSVYEHFKLPMFKKVLWVDSPFQGSILAASLAEGKPTELLRQIAPEICGDEPLQKLTVEEIKKQAETASYGSFDAFWTAFYTFINEELPVEKDPLVDIANDLVKNTGVYWLFEDYVVASEKPKTIKLKDGKPHCEDGFAIEYRDGSGLFFYNGEIKQNLVELRSELNYKK